MSHFHYAMTRFIACTWADIFTYVLAPETTQRWSFTAECGHTRLRISELAGRLMVQFEDINDPECYVCYITSDRDATGDGFGIQSYAGTMRAHEAMIQDIMVGWELHGKTLFKHATQTIG